MHRNLLHPNVIFYSLQKTLMLYYLYCREVKKYTEKILVYTYIPEYYKTITLQGHGSFNEMFYYKDLH